MDATSHDPPPPDLPARIRVRHGHGLIDLAGRAGTWQRTEPARKYGMTAFVSLDAADDRPGIALWVCPDALEAGPEGDPPGGGCCGGGCGRGEP